ncbi:hypothetical protein SKDZ_12G3690 [Saccharomyces kudriavzevii ZP591]|nr:hypothetical protein SKDZ_12G3690 [Saccharomyces kudriavzevii ZP591]
MLSATKTFHNETMSFVGTIINYPSITGYALHPSRNSYGYIIYVPSLKKTIDTTNYVISHGEQSRLDQFNYDALTFEADINRLTAPYQSFIEENEAEQSYDLNIESDQDLQSDIELNPDSHEYDVPTVTNDSTHSFNDPKQLKPAPTTTVRAPREVNADISTSNILPSCKRTRIIDISDTDNTESGGITQADIPSPDRISDSKSSNSNQGNGNNNFIELDSPTDAIPNSDDDIIPSLGGTNGQTISQHTGPDNKINDGPPAIEESLPENQSPDSTFPKTTSDTSPEVTTVESLIADLPLPDLPREPSIKLPLSLKEPPPIHSRQTNSSLGGMDDPNVSTNTKSKKRSLEEDKTEIKVSRDTWNAKNMRI